MRVKCLHKWVLFIVLLCFYNQEIQAQIDTLSIDNSFVNKKVEDFMFLYSSDKKTSLDTSYLNSLTYKKEGDKCIFFDLNNDYCYLSFSVLNTSAVKEDLILEISNTLINEIKLSFAQLWEVRSPVVACRVHYTGSRCNTIELLQHIRSV